MRVKFKADVIKYSVQLITLICSILTVFSTFKAVAEDAIKPGIIGEIPEDWYEQLTIQALTDTATNFVIPGEVGLDKKVEDHYWIGSRESFSRTITPILYIRLSDKDEYLELPVRFEFARKETSISSQYFIDKKFRNGILIENRGNSVRSIYPGSSKTRMMVLLSDPSGDSIQRGAVLCVYSAKPEVKIRFKSVQLEGKGSANAVLSSGLKPGRAVLEFTPLELMAKPKFAKDEAFNRNPAVELKYGGAEAPPKVNFEPDKDLLGQLGVRFNFTLHSGNTRTSNLVESLLIHNFTPRPSLQDLMRGVFPDEITDAPLNCVAMLGVYQQKFSYTTVDENYGIEGE